MNVSLVCRIGLVALMALSAAGCGTKCGPSNCGGCCSATGVCEAPSASFCGLGGGVCDSCTALQTCNAGMCSFESGPASTSGSTGSPTIGTNSTSSGATNSTAGSTGGTTASHGSTSGGTSTGQQTHSTSTGGTNSGTSSSQTTASTTNASTSATTASNTSTSTGTTASPVTSTSTGGTSTTTASSTTASSSGGSSGASICSQCTLNTQCASGYCNTSSIPGFCDSAQACVSGGTAAQDCSPYSCVSGDCACPATTGSTGSTGAACNDCAALQCSFIGEVCDTTTCQCVPPTTSTTGSSGSTGTTGSIAENGADTCVSTAPTLTVNQPVTGTTQPFNDNYEADGLTTDTCFPGATFPGGTCQGPDVAYVFTPPSSGTYVFTATPDSTYDIALVVFQGMCQNPIVSCVLGVDAQPQGGVESGSVNLTGGTPYYVLVDGYADDGGNDGFDYGTYTLEVSTPPACAAANLDQLSGPGTSETETGDTTSTTQTYGGSCAGTFITAANAVYYTFTTTQTSNLTANVTTTDTAYQPVISLGTGCGATYAESTCNSAATTATSLSETSLPAGSYTLVVSGVGMVFGTGTAGPYSLDVELSAPIPPPSNDTCSGATPLTLTNFSDGGMGTTLTVSNLGANNDTIPSTSGQCGSEGRGPDIVYSLTFANAIPGMTATLSPGPDGGLNLPVVSIQAAPCYENSDGGDIANELACGDSQNGGPITATITTSQRAGTFFIWVDEISSGVPGVGTLQITVP